MINIVLIGFMGTGKTIVGKRLAARLGWEFIDTDSEVEQVTGKTIPQIFTRDGEIRFRSEERIVMQKLALRQCLVIATGGGAVLDPENVANLKKNGILICLSADPETIYYRVKGKRHRPLLDGKDDLRRRIGELLIERAPAYQVADFTVDTSRCRPDEVVDKIVDYLKIYFRGSIK
ncbi:MAG TPA: shikimate kinase [Desulfotomaculum sp.]|nr:shikimate kinase [Desulfotomaculum sp.]